MSSLGHQAEEFDILINEQIIFIYIIYILYDILIYNIYTRRYHVYIHTIYASSILI